MSMKGCESDGDRGTRRPVSYNWCKDNFDLTQVKVGKPPSLACGIQPTRNQEAGIRHCHSFAVAQSLQPQVHLVAAVEVVRVAITLRALYKKTLPPAT